jgi:hypothetical protein
MAEKRSTGINNFFTPMALNIVSDMVWISLGNNREEIFHVGKTFYNGHIFLSD